MANHKRDKAQDVEVINQPQEVVTVANETIHLRTKGSEVGHGLMVSEPPLEEPNCVLLIVVVLGVQTATGEEKIGCLNKVGGGKELKMPRAKGLPMVRVHPPRTRKNNTSVADVLARPSQPNTPVAVRSHNTNCNR